jgi:hypothetical protein
LVELPSCPFWNGRVVRARCDAEEPGGEHRRRGRSPTGDRVRIRPRERGRQRGEDEVRDCERRKGVEENEVAAGVALAETPVKQERGDDRDDRDSRFEGDVEGGTVVSGVDENEPADEDGRRSRDDRAGETEMNRPQLSLLTCSLPDFSWFSYSGDERLKEGSSGPKPAPASAFAFPVVQLGLVPQYGLVAGRAFREGRHVAGARAPARRRTCGAWACPRRRSATPRSRSRSG